VGYASLSVAVEVLAAPPPGAVVAPSLTLTETVADVVDVGCGHGALCAYVCESEPVYTNVSPDAIGRGAAIALRGAVAINGVCPTQPYGLFVGAAVGVGPVDGDGGGGFTEPPPPPPHATRAADINASPIAKKRVFTEAPKCRLVGSKAHLIRIRPLRLISHATEL
jgi:hypothetical protein